MGYEYETVQVSVRNRTLWVGNQAYPLHNIARVQAGGWEPNRGAAVRAFIRTAVKWIMIGAAALTLLVCLGDQVPVGAYVVVILALAAILALHGVRLARALAEPNLYALVVETAGSPHAALISVDRQMVYGLVRQVVEAIDNPAKEFAINVQHVYGDKVSGDKFTGDKIGSNKIMR